MKSIFLIAFVFITHHSIAQEVCEQALSAIQKQELEKPKFDKADFLKNAEIKLERDLQEIRSFPEEPRLKEQGFTPIYYAGVDQAREFKRVQEYLQEIKADPEQTHIPYFADQIETTLADFEKKLKRQHKGSSFLEERIKALTNFKEEAHRRIKDQTVTYNWWADFNFRLAVIASKENGSPDGIVKHKFSGLDSFTYMKREFPRKVMFFSTNDLGIMAFNKIGYQSHLVGVSGETQEADGRKMDSLVFFLHDIDHISFGVKHLLIAHILLNGVKHISNISDQRKAELAVFIFLHEDGRHILRDPFFTQGINLSQLEKLRAPLRTESRELMKKIAVRFMNPSDLKPMLPDELQNAVDVKDIHPFLEEVADIFSDLLRTPQENDLLALELEL